MHDFAVWVVPSRTFTFRLKDKREDIAIFTTVCLIHNPDKTVIRISQSMLAISMRSMSVPAVRLLQVRYVRYESNAFDPSLVFDLLSNHISHCD